MPAPLSIPAIAETGSSVLNLPSDAQHFPAIRSPFEDSMVKTDSCPQSEYDSATDIFVNNSAGTDGFQTFQFKKGDNVRDLSLELKPSFVSIHHMDYWSFYSQ